MQHSFVSIEDIVMHQTGFAVRKIVGVLAVSLLLIPGLALAVSEQVLTPQPAGQEQTMDHSMEGMDHSMEGMDHSMHQHQLSMKGKYTSSMATYTVPDIKMVDKDGVQVALLAALNNADPVILNFIYTSCTTICPVMSSTFKQVQAKLGQKRGNVRLISISIDPENDTPAKLREYAGKYQAGAHWSFLTGTYENSVSVQKAFGVFAGEKMNHKPVIFLKAKGSENQWVRLDGLINAPDVIKELDKLNSK